MCTYQFQLGEPPILSRRVVLTDSWVFVFQPTGSSKYLQFSATCDRHSFETSCQNGRRASWLAFDSLSYVMTMFAIIVCMGRVEGGLEKSSAKSSARTL